MSDGVSTLKLTTKRRIITTVIIHSFNRLDRYYRKTTVKKHFRDCANFYNLRFLFTGTLINDLNGNEYLHSISITLVSVELNWL